MSLSVRICVTFRCLLAALVCAGYGAGALAELPAVPVATAKPLMAPPPSTLSIGAAPVKGNVSGHENTALIPTRTVQTTGLSFVGLFAGEKPMATQPLSFQGMFAGEKQMATFPLSFQGIFSGERSISTSALLFVGSYIAPLKPPALQARPLVSIPPTGIKGVQK
jgi:hypothetical protein